MKKVILVHGWGGTPDSDWYNWFVRELGKKGIKAEAPEMPETFKPTIIAWTEKLKQVAGKIDQDTYLVGHSIGCQTILRFLEKEKIKIGGVILVAGWLDLTGDTWDEDYTREIAEQWIKTPINFKEIKNKAKKFIIINSDNDPYVYLKDADILEKELGAEKMILHNKGHITGEDGIREFPLLLDKILEMKK